MLRSLKFLTNCDGGDDWIVAGGVIAHWEKKMIETNKQDPWGERYVLYLF